MKMKGMTRQISVLVATIAVILVNYASIAFKLGGLTTGQVADLYKIKFYPAGYAFSIWGLIYLGLCVFTVWQMLPAQKNNEKLDRIGMYYIYTSIGNITWIFLWQYQYPALSIISIVFMLVTLLAAYREIMTDMTTNERLLVGIPFSLYTGWISVATIACISAGLFSVGWDGFGISDNIWAVIMMVVALLIVGFTVWKFRDWVWALVYIWAIVAIAMRFADIQLIAITAYVCSGLMAVVAVLALFLNKSKS
jgi:hypothetical protein